MPAEPPADGRGSGGRQGDSLFASTFDAAMLEAGLRGLGVHPDDVVTLLRYAPLALTHICWRNSILEDWHASPDSRISDADMMRTNVATTRLFHQALWGVFDGQLADASLTCRADLTDDDIEPLTLAFEDVLEVAFASDRALPHGPTLGEVGGDEVSREPARGADRTGRGPGCGGRAHVAGAARSLRLRDLVGLAPVAGYRGRVPHPPRRTRRPLLGA